ncbi:hypothetical protein [uncultured Aquimarina sp.]|uniref:hypothetical protein n=1 Tax=uncultured Aquimarina sp. TaxID=575652 RepID=UPI002626D104|nr:hypothetical protein [uncultured Aquimarina sp.]
MNNLEKLEKAKYIYKGIELDVVFKSDSMVFDIYHPPEQSKGLYLRGYLAESTENPKLLYWLDLKNLTPENAIIASEYLKELTDKNIINPKNVIVESPNIKYLNHFKNKGFNTSFYFPSDLSLLEGEKLKVKIRELQSLLSKYPTTMISSNAIDYSVLSFYFPEKDKNLWIFAELKNIKSLRQRLSLYRRLFDNSVKIILFKTE